MNLDPRTVVILTVLSTLLMSISLFAVARGYLAEMRGVARWASGTLLQSAGWVMLAFIGILPSYISEIGSPLIMLGLALYYHALVEFKEISSKVFWVYVVVTLNVIAIYYFLLVTPNMAMRIVVASSTAAILMFASARLLFSGRLSKLPISHGMTGVLFAVCSVILVIRAIYYLVWNTAPDQSAFEHNDVQDIAFLTFFLAGVVSPFTFILMCNDRYNDKALLRANELAGKNKQLEEADRAKGQFLATMSHELRTPLNGVVGFLNQLRKTKLDDQQKDFLHTIDLSARTLLSVINDVLDFSKIEAGKLNIETVEINLREFIDETISMFAANAEDKGLDLICVVDHKINNYLMGDPLRLTQILSNLLGNAIKFTEKGEVLLEVKQMDETDSNVSLQITVSDTGIGISQDSLERLFQPFVQADASTTRKHGGTGLGLIIARHLLHMMGGSIEVESEMWHGTRFKIHLGLSKQSVSTAINLSVDLSYIRILVVSSNTNIVRSVTENLSVLGVISESASSGLAALSLIKESSKEKQDFHAIIFDNAVKDILPKDFSGKLKGANSTTTIPVLLLVRLAEAHVKETLVQGDFSCCLSKPVKSLELCKEVARLFGTRHADLKLNSAAVQNSGGIALQNPLGGKRILIVDDNNINRKLMQLLVEELGGEFDLAENGIQAVDACSRKKYDLILMDVNMPVMDGLEATNRIRALESTSRRTPIFALTANTLPSDREKFLDCGMDDYLSKPINEKLLRNMLDKWCPQDIGSSDISSADLAEDLSNKLVPALDPALGVQLSFGDSDTWDMVLGLMLDELSDYSSKLDDFAHDTEQLGNLSHKLVGSSCYCGTPALNQAAKQVEIISAQGDTQLLGQALAELHQEIDRMLKLDAAGKLRKSTVLVY